MIRYTMTCMAFAKSYVKWGTRGALPMRMKLSGLPLCKAGDWGLQTPEKCFCFGFFAASPQKNQNKKGFGAAPQWEISVSFMRMGARGALPLATRFRMVLARLVAPRNIVDGMFWWGCEGTYVPSRSPGSTALRILHDILWCYRRGFAAPKPYEISAADAAPDVARLSQSLLSYDRRLCESLAMTCYIMA